ncbi:MAG: hypothetical protein ACOCYG_01480 [Spirochaetota bacterium]
MRYLPEAIRAAGRLLLLSMLTGLALVPLRGQESVDSQLFFTLWVDLEPAIAGGEATPRTEERAAEILFQEAIFVASGLIYGYTYEYVPSDSARRIREDFTLTPRAEVRRGDPRLEATESYVRDKRVYSKFRYRLEPFQQQWLESWASSALPRVEGVGEAPWWQGHESKLASVEEAVKSAVRNHLRSQVPNKPRRSRGSVILTRAPRVFVDAGAYRAEVSIRIKVADVDPQEVF